MVKRKIPSPCRESNPRTPNRPARSLVACVICTLCDRWRFLPVKYLSFENIVYLDRFHCFFQYVYDYQIVYNRPQMLLPHRFWFTCYDHWLLQRSTLHGVSLCRLTELLYRLLIQYQETSNSSRGLLGFTALWRWKQHFPPKRWYPVAALHGITTQLMSIWNLYRHGNLTSHKLVYSVLNSICECTPLLQLNFIYVFFFWGGGTSKVDPAIERLEAGFSVSSPE